MRRTNDGWRLLVAIAVLAGFVAGLTSPGQVRADGRLKVVATFSVLADVVANVGGDKVDVVTLVGINGDAHTFEPSPRDIAKLLDAKLVFENGLGFEPWLDEIYDAAGTDAQRVVVTRTITPRRLDDGHGAATPGADEHSGDHGEDDPHVWHDVRNVMAEVAVIRDALVAADPANAATYQANADAYLAQLGELDAWVVQQVATVPAEHRKLVTSHDTFGYFADRYGFQVIGTALNSMTTEAGDPSAGQIADLVAEIRAAGVPAIFAENVHNADLMKSIASEAGVTLAPDLYSDALGPADSPGGTYLGMIRFNVETIVAALAPAG